MEHIIHNFAQGSLFACTEQLFKQLNIELHSSEDLPILPQDFFDKELYRPENKVHQLIQQLYVAGMIGTEEDCLAVIAVELATTATTRTQLSTITRLINRQAEGMPVAVLFRYGNHIALANAERTQYKQTNREEEKIGKVSILKDIDILNPHRGHLDILETLKIPAKINTFRDLYAHWQEVFNVSTLNKKFYNELFAWFQWTISEEVGITYPNDTKTDQDDRVQLEEQVIRLITRVLFVWFIKQKHLVPNNLFEEAELGKILKDFQANSLEKGNYYNAILQNLFFATLNKKVTERAFAKVQGSRDIKTLYRYADMFTITEEEVIALFASIPFLNGGLFECLDKDKGNDGVRYHLDGFSRNDRKSDHNGHYTHRAFIPNAVFFDSQKGLFPLLNRYHFTIEENTPNELQVALDPELLGNVFENLLGAFNPETKESARKQSGSFYTPKEVVNYMVDESLKTYLHNQLPTSSSESLNMLFEETELSIEWLSQPANCQRVVETLEKVKILDPACGSGAFPMGILNRMVYLLEKLDFLEKRSLYELKLHLIQNCIYGVDIQTIASQISKLRFFISLIVEQEETNTDAEQNYGVHTLPNLETKFVTANTLISLEKEDNIELFNDERLVTLKEKLFKVRTEHFYAQSAFKKKELRKEDAEICENIKQYLLDIAIKPNEQHIAFWEKSIERLQTEREKYVAERWEEVPMQVDMFAEAKSTKVDVNLAKRKGIDSKIKELQNFIDKEYHKTESDALKKELETLASWNPYDQNASAPFFDPEWMFGISDGFDIVIGNPPYVSTKGVTSEFKKALEKEYGFADDTYNHFFFRGYQILRDKGILSFITPKTFWTTQTKRNLRDLLLSQRLEYIFDTANPFESAMVDTCITSFSKVKPENNTLLFLDGSKDLENPLRYDVAQNVFIDTQNSVIFKPTEYNMKIHNLYGKKVKELYEQWWDKISTSKNITKYSKELEAYRQSLKPGDIALLGCLTEGGQGLATANNGKYIAVRKSTKWAKNILESRPKKLLEVVKRYKTAVKVANEEEAKDYLAALSEEQIATLFDELKEKFGRDIFGQGYIYRLIEDDEMADVEALTQDEKDNGIEPTKKFYVPYDKGDKDGNRWYLETPFAIAWNKENVGFLKSNSGKKGEGMPVVRNPQYYFKEGFCWSAINGTRSSNELKFRFKQKSVTDVQGMSLHSNSISSKYIVSICNSDFISRYTESFVNSTVIFQINDARQIPIIIPTEKELEEFEELFNLAFETKKVATDKKILSDKSENQLLEIQKKLDTMVNELYGV